MERTQAQYKVTCATVDMLVSQHPQAKRHGGSPERSGKSSQRRYEPKLVLERTGQVANHPATAAEPQFPDSLPRALPTTKSIITAAGEMGTGASVEVPQKLI